MRKRKIYLEDIIDRMVDKLYRARAICCSPGDNFAIDLLLDIRDDARRCVSVSRSRIFNAKRGGLTAGSKSNVKSSSVFVQTEFMV